MTTPLPDIEVLVVDDEAFQLRLVARQLSNLGVHQVQTCQRADLALDLLREQPTRFALVCCDLQMPGMDGVEFVRHLGHMAYPGALALISGEDRRILHTADGLGRAHGLRLLDPLQKPVDPQNLQRLLVQARRPDARRPLRSHASYTAARLAQGIDGHELVVHYQPQVNLKTGRVRGLEALVRWDHPDDGLVGPDAFIALAEDAGLIDALTRSVLVGPRGALDQLRRWQVEGHALQLAVNVSMPNLHDHRFPEFLARAALDAHLQPSSLSVEVTESRVMTDPRTALDVLARLRLKRIGVSIDDFGTGHSSLAQLRDLPFDELKIDRGFVHGACHRHDLSAILLPSVQMAHELGLCAVAEGVEGFDDWHFLRSHGCDVAQGYFIGRPMPAHELPRWLAAWERRRGELVGEVCLG